MPSARRALLFSEEKQIKDFQAKLVVAWRRGGVFCKGIVSTPTRRGPTFL